jgi:microcystin-dependent protein
MARSWNASDATPGGDIIATQYNNLRSDVEAVYREVVPVGTVLMWAGTDANVPTNWLLCNGAAISRSTYSDLFNSLGSGFGGGNGSTTFNIPDMRDRFVVGAGTTYSRNGKGGSTSVTLSTAQLAAHTHTITHKHTITHTHSVSGNTAYTNPAHAHRVSVRTGVSSGNTYAQGTASGWGSNIITAGTTEDIDHRHSISFTSGASSAANTGASSAASTGSAGSGTAHENRPPYIGMFYIIKALAEE